MSVDIPEVTVPMFSLITEVPLTVPQPIITITKATQTPTPAALALTITATIQEVHTTTVLLPENTNRDQ
jgi:hypothetical protein